MDAASLGGRSGSTMLMFYTQSIMRRISQANNGMRYVTELPQSVTRIDLSEEGAQV